MNSENRKELNMNIKNLNDQILVQKTEVLVREEREILKNLLQYFREIERRRLFCDYKYGSLHKMLVGHFGYSDDEAYRRVSAMKLVKELPEVEEKITNGELSLSHLGLAQTFFKKEAKIQKAEISKEIKLELLSQISDQPIREAQKIVLSHSSDPEELRPDKVTVITEEKAEYRFTANQSIEAKILEVKGLLAHKYPSLSMGELLEVLCDLGIETLKNQKTATPRKSCVTDSTIPQDFGTSLKQIPKQFAKQVHTRSMGLTQKPNGQSDLETSIRSSHIWAKRTSYAQTKREIWIESQFQCSNCHSQYAMETDHRIAIAKGGSNEKTNLRVLCRSCNQRAAIKQLGQVKMDQHLN